MVSTSLASELCDQFDITIISSAKVINPCYKIDPRIKVISLNIPNEIMTIDQSLHYFSQQKSYKKWICTVFGAIKWMIFKRHKIRKNIGNMIVKDDATLICSAIDSYWLAPKKGRVFFHFHFNKNVYFSFSNRLVMALTRKPDKLIFLSKGTSDEVIKKYPKLKSKITYVHNALRFTSDYQPTYNGNKILFLGRFSPEKNPMFALKVAKALKEDHFDFHLTLSGHGALQKPMEEYIKSNNLKDVITITGIINVQTTLPKYDLVILPSLHEGFGLTIIEANACSVPVISSNWGDAINEVMNDNINGYVINQFDEHLYANKIKDVLKDKNTLIALKKSSYEHSKNFTIDKIIPSWIDILK